MQTEHLANKAAMWSSERNQISTSSTGKDIHGDPSIPTTQDAHNEAAQDKLWTSSLTQTSNATKTISLQLSAHKHLISVHDHQLIQFYSFKVSAG